MWNPFSSNLIDIGLMYIERKTDDTMVGSWKKSIEFRRIRWVHGPLCTTSLVGMIRKTSLRRNLDFGCFSPLARPFRLGVATKDRANI
jgi:hypothetical protein